MTFFCVFCQYVFNVGTTTSTCKNIWSVLLQWQIGNECSTFVSALIPNTSIGAFALPNHCISPLMWMCRVNVGLTRGHVYHKEETLAGTQFAWVPLESLTDWRASSQSGTNGRRAKFTPGSIGTVFEGGLIACSFSAQHHPCHPQIIIQTVA